MNDATLGFQQINNATSTLISSASVSVDFRSNRLHLVVYTVPSVSVSTYKLPEHIKMLQQTMSALLGFQQPTTAADTFPSFGRVGCCGEGCTHRSADAHKLYDSRGPRPRPQHAVIISRTLAASYIVGLHFSTIKLFSDGGRDRTFCLCSS